MVLIFQKTKQDKVFYTCTESI